MIDWQQFASADVISRLTIFKGHLSQGGLATEDAFQMLDAIHTQLEQQHGGRHTAYANYAAVIQQLQQHDVALYDQVVERYAAKHAAAEDHDIE